MSLLILLDSAPLGLVTNPKESAETLACREWLRQTLQNGHDILVPAITDYAVRRELMLFNKINGLRNLDALKAAAVYLLLTPDALLQAAAFWSEARKLGLPTADRAALDADVILAAQAATLNPAEWEKPDARVVIATSNVGHLNRLVEARLWSAIV